MVIISITLKPINYADPSKLFELLFDDQKVSDGRLSQLGQGHLEAIKTNDTAGFFAALIEPTTKALEAFTTTQTDKATLKAITEGATLNVDLKLKEFKQKALQREGLIRDTFGTGSPRYQEFYPHGTTEYTKCTKTTAEILMERMSAAYTRNAAELPSERVEEFNALYATYKTARSAQVEKKSGIGKKQESKDSSRAQLEYQLQYNLFTIAMKYIGQPEMCSVYFNLALLKPYKSRSRKKEEDVKI